MYFRKVVALTAIVLIFVGASGGSAEAQISEGVSLSKETQPNNVCHIFPFFCEA